MGLEEVEACAGKIFATASHLGAALPLSMHLLSLNTTTHNPSPSCLSLPSSMTISTTFNDSLFPQFNPCKFSELLTVCRPMPLVQLLTKSTLSQQLVSATGNLAEQSSDVSVSEDFYYQVYSHIRAGQHRGQPVSSFAQTYLFHNMRLTAAEMHSLVDKESAENIYCLFTTRFGAQRGSEQRPCPSPSPVGQYH